MLGLRGRTKKRNSQNEDLIYNHILHFWKQLYLYMYTEFEPYDLIQSTDKYIEVFVNRHPFKHRKSIEKL